ncbi:isochorismatase family cysteine hydrolase [Vibrio superstes]|uniref:Hydrolase n=1 Tax=Vibrio superstes NBRC 103154 TaxID=1219062 RepID=A0A511QV67_9VIBR|nr:isochorismatase family cysteine hydrolase [Vibrio superstes]GEM81261.1 hydrolase [Vibrio superstes NBRC 103154]
MGISEHSALIVIDLQEGIVDKVPAEVATSVISNSLALCGAFERARLPVFVVNVAGRAKGLTEVQQRASKRAQASSATVWGPLIESFSNNPNFKYLTKYSWGAFTNTGLHDQLKAQGITDVYLTGVATSVGVESTARQAFELDYNVVIVEDAIADMDLICHQHSCERVFPKMSVLMSSEQIIKG